MTGKFTGNNVFTVIWLLTFFGGCILYMWCECNDYINSNFIEIKFMLIMIALTYVESKLFSKGSFTANENKIFFRIGLIKHTYIYSEIESAETETNFSRGRYGMYPHVYLIIKLTNGKNVTFCDDNVPTDVLSTPEKYKEFHDNHQFTKLSYYINERTGKPDSKI